MLIGQQQLFRNSMKLFRCGSHYRTQTQSRHCRLSRTDRHQKKREMGTPGSPKLRPKERSQRVAEETDEENQRRW
jgi:hypothetical protein